MNVTTDEVVVVHKNEDDKDENEDEVDTQKEDVEDNHENDVEAVVMHENKKDVAVNVDDGEGKQTMIDNIHEEDNGHEGVDVDVDVENGDVVVMVVHLGHVPPDREYYDYDYTENVGKSDLAYHYVHTDDKHVVDVDVDVEGVVDVNANASVNENVIENVTVNENENEFVNVFANVSVNKNKIGLNYLSSRHRSELLHAKTWNVSCYDAERLLQEQEQEQAQAQMWVQVQAHLVTRISLSGQDFSMWPRVHATQALLCHGVYEKRGRTSGQKQAEQTQAKGRQTSKKAWLSNETGDENVRLS